MQKLFDEVSSLDKRCYEEFGLSEDILMEHASNGIANYIRKNFVLESKILIVCGGGNNGADGIACARLLHKDYDVNIFYLKKPKSKMAILQEKRAIVIKVNVCDEVCECDVLVDSIVGTGFKGEFNSEIKEIITKINSLNAFKIACDVPSSGFISDLTLTMGALKKSMFLDGAKDFMGQIKVLNLGISREIYEGESNWNLLDLEDLKLPYRTKKDSHKGSFGHLAVACGEKPGASILSASSALRFGTGLVTLVGFNDNNIPDSIMYSHETPLNSTALALGMGLGDEFSDIEIDKFLDNSLPMICDADIFSIRREERGATLGVPIVLEILCRENLVLTPHPKEFVSLLKITKLADIEIKELQKNRFKYVELFCEKFPHITLLLKGANVIIAQNDKFFINPHGTSALAKGGSGDILSGLVGALLAQGNTTLESAINASLAHTKLALNYKGADFSLTPNDLIDGICNL
ncbi:MAG: NAD(P)H-hydrate dehydratase [Campylobacterota bacterium]|nr:NAD(P)H-hydrate dehydratase [Campylobacterota bacterium]